LPVLLIDADLPTTDLPPGFRRSKFSGLSEYLKGEATEMAVIQRGLPEYLCFIGGGNKPEKSRRIACQWKPKISLGNGGGRF